MVDKKILELFDLNREIEFDYTKYLSNFQNEKKLLEQSIEYYDMKYRICKAIAPNSIVNLEIVDEISIISLLHAAPFVEYTGIYNNVVNKNKVKENIYEYEKRVGCIQKVNILNEKMIDARNYFSQSVFDLLYISGEKDGDKLYELLSMGLEKSNWIWVDGFYANTENMLSVSFFTQKYKDFIEYCLITHSYSGDIIIKIKKNYIKFEKTYKLLEKTYDKNYYLTNCGGYNEFLESEGESLDERLREIYQLINPKKGEKILDVGCGRGELTYALANSGATVIGVDYSKEAIQIAKSTFGKKENLNLIFLEGDVVNLKREYSFDKIVMADVYEHIEDEYLVKLLINLKGMLADNGKLFIHTAPNKDYYDFVYKKNVRKAKDMGLYLPSNPRTIFEDTMHINEQTPSNIRNTLRKYFRDVLIWTGSGQKILKNDSVLESKLDNQIYAICSNNMILNEYIESIKYKPINKKNLNIEIETLVKEIKITKNEEIEIEIKIINNSDVELESREPYPVNISYHILNEEKEVLINDGIRTVLIKPIRAFENKKVKVKLSNHNLEEGKYIYRVTMVQEGQFWFDDMFQIYVDINVIY